MGGQVYKTWWLLKPSVLKNMLSYVKSFGQFSSDALDKKTQKLGGTIVVKDGKVVWVHRETSTFYNGDAKEVLAAVLGKTVDELRDIKLTPEQTEVTESCARK